MGRTGDVGDWLWYWTHWLSKDHLPFFLYGLHTIWFCRNEFAHRKAGMDPLSAASSARFRIASFTNPYFKFHVIEEPANLVWVRPTDPFLKINCDGSWSSSSTRIGYGCVARDSLGQVMAVRAGFRLNGSSSLDAEGLSLFYAMQWAAVWDGNIAFLKRTVLSSST